MEGLPLDSHDWHGTWNYRVRTQASVPASVPRFQDRSQPKERTPAWLRHLELTGLAEHEFTALLAKVERYILDHPPISLHHKRARHRILRRGPLSLPDRLLVALIHLRWKTRYRDLTALLSSPRAAVGDAIHEITPVLEGLGRVVKTAPITACTAQNLAGLVGRSSPKKQ